MNKAPTNSTAKQPNNTTQNKTVVNTAKSSTVTKAPVNTTASKSVSSTQPKPVNNTAKTSNIKPTSTNSTKVSSTSTAKSSSSKPDAKLTTNKTSTTTQQKKPDQKPDAQQVKEVKQEPIVKKMNVEHIKLQQLFNKIEEYRDKNRSLLIIDKLQANDSFTFFKYKGYIADVSEYLIKEQTNTQNREKSVETARKQVVYSLKAGGTLVFFVDSMLVDLPNFFKEAQFFSPSQLFVPEEVQKDTYYVQKLLKEEENVDGFGNKGGYYPKKEFAATILSKTSDMEPDELIKKLNMPADLFDCIIIS
ncbi:hypothetical protein TTHERM_00532150 (macronuclear) [Tetrahymena thermophila SB210]|uniref:Uncharacterized protein n=1 Tax=Tetrahymena thermophila (strain SB210) TaxID=312017 RepID=Q248F2_TETTS|nr:hypothetical protein TTHERM_00532150 [Tetrahymena thermophila SB210]EAS04093.1 hypothetical protein TTHERM_00532150 [Tetrahymena thermophila SB210]|eukprot:XP_001024338.1 hypothetical protein TTHERM_00532150 [Tetrahymena thermophila SB210]